MKIFINLDPDRILLLRANTKNEAIKELAASLSGICRTKGDELVALVKEKDTGIEIAEGVAIVNLKMREYSSFYLAFGLSREGLNGNGNRIYFLFFLISPERQIEKHLRVLSYIARLVTDFRERLLRAKTVQELREIFEEYEDSL